MKDKLYICQWCGGYCTEMGIPVYLDSNDIDIEVGMEEMTCTDCIHEGKE